MWTANYWAPNYFAAFYWAEVGADPITGTVCTLCLLGVGM